MLNVNLKKIILKTPQGKITLLSDIKFIMPENKIFTIVGGNGAGKSTLLKSLTRLLPENIFEIDGEIYFNNINILDSNKDQINIIRKNHIKYIFQDPVTSFDPLKKLRYYFQDYIPGKEIYIDKLFDYFLLPRREILFEMYPYQLSGGMAQRLSLAIASAASPEILILDEPTSGIDAPMVNLVIHFLKNFTKEKNNSVLLVTHDLLYAKSISDYISTIKDGHLSGFLSVEEFFSRGELTDVNIYG